MAYLDQQRWKTLQAMGITDPGEAAIVAMMEAQTSILSDILAAMGGGSSGELTQIAQAVQQISSEMVTTRTVSISGFQEIASDLTNINDTLEDIEDRMPGPPNP